MPAFSTSIHVQTPASGTVSLNVLVYSAHISIRILLYSLLRTWLQSMCDCASFFLKLKQWHTFIYSIQISWMQLLHLSLPSEAIFLTGMHVLLQQCTAVIKTEYTGK